MNENMNEMEFRIKQFCDKKYFFTKKRNKCLKVYSETFNGDTQIISRLLKLYLHLDLLLSIKCQSKRNRSKKDKHGNIKIQFSCPTFTRYASVAWLIKANYYIECGLITKELGIDFKSIETIESFKIYLEKHTEKIDILFELFEKLYHKVIEGVPSDDDYDIIDISQEKKIATEMYFKKTYIETIQKKMNMFYNDIFSRIIEKMQDDNIENVSGVIKEIDDFILSQIKYLEPDISSRMSSSRMSSPRMSSRKSVGHLDDFN